MRNKRDKDECSPTLLLGASSFESFSEILLKGRVNIGPYTVEVEVPKNSTIWCWTGGREGHFQKICTAQDMSKREKTLRIDARKRKTQLHSENGQSCKSKVKRKGKANKNNRGKRRFDKVHNEDGRQEKYIYVLIMYMLVHQDTQTLLIQGVPKETVQ